MWLPISPLPFIERVRGRGRLLVYARYDLTFPVHLSQMLVNEFRRREIPHDSRCCRAGTTARVRRRSNMDGLRCAFLRGALRRGSYRYFINP